MVHQGVYKLKYELGQNAFYYLILYKYVLHRGYLKSYIISNYPCHKDVLLYEQFQNNCGHYDQNIMLCVIDNL